MKKDNSTGKSIDFYNKGQAIFDRIPAYVQASKTILNPKHEWPFKSPASIRPLTKKLEKELENEFLFTLPKAPF